MVVVFISLRFIFDLSNCNQGEVMVIFIGGPCDVVIPQKSYDYLNPNKLTVLTPLHLKDVDEIFQNNKRPWLFIILILL